MIVHTGRIDSIPAMPKSTCWGYGFTNCSMALPKSPFDHRQQILHKKILLKESDK